LGLGTGQQSNFIYGLGQWSKIEMTQINDAAALELHTINMAVEATAAWINKWWPKPPDNPNGVGPFCWFDLLQVADNQSAAEHIGNREHASGDAERHLIRRRSQLLRNLQVRVQSHPAVRECISVQAADDLSMLTKDRRCIQSGCIVDNERLWLVAKRETTPTATRSRRCPAACITPRTFAACSISRCNAWSTLSYMYSPMWSKI
jgi:hypothetical protein